MQCSKKVQRSKKTTVNDHQLKTRQLGDWIAENKGILEISMLKVYESLIL